MFDHWICLAGSYSRSFEPSPTARERLRQQIAPRYQAETGATLDAATFDVLADEPVCVLYLASQVYGIYQRAIRKHGFSNKRHAGAVDMDQSVYLAMCDLFVTDDTAQYRGLRVLNRFNKRRRTKVVRYDTFRSRLLVL